MTESHEASLRARPLGIVLILIAAAVLRVCAARGDLWLDEIWSLRMSQQVGSELGILTELHHDNNHHLNTLFLRLVGPGAQPFAYRTLSLLAGLGTVVLAYLIGRKRSRAEGWIAAGLFALSFPMIVYDSEARGYALAVLFALTAYLAMDRYLERGGLATALGFGLVSILGVLSHPTFLYAYLAAFSWWGVRAWRQRSVIRGFLELHVIPLLAFLGLYWVDLRFMKSGGGTPSSWVVVWLQALSLDIGGPQFSAAAIACGLLALAVAVLALFVIRGDRSGRTVFFVAAVVVVPGVLCAVVPTDVIYERYFLVSLAFLLLLVASVLAQLLRLGTLGRAAAIVCCALFVAGNGVHCARFLRYGRGSYLGAARYLRDSTTEPAVTVASDHDFRNEVVLEYAIERLGSGKPVAFYTLDAWPTPEPEWLLAHRQDPAPALPIFRMGQAGATYRMTHVFPYGGLSGWDWVVYRRD